MEQKVIKKSRELVRWLQELDQKVAREENLARRALGSARSHAGPFVPIFEGSQPVPGCYRARKLGSEGGDQ